MANIELLRTLKRMAYMYEMAARDYKGELKWSLYQLCENIRNDTPGFDAPELKEYLDGLEQVQDLYLRDQHEFGFDKLCLISERLWRSALPEDEDEDEDEDFDEDEDAE